MAEHSDAGTDHSGGREAASIGEQGISMGQAGKSAGSEPIAPSSHRPKWRRRLAIVVLAVLVLAAILKYGVP
jgi:hypothetical protein